MREAQELSFTTFDGETLFYRHWQGSDTKRVIILFHRGHEHSGRLQVIVDELNLPDASMFAWDARGHGYSAGLRGYSPSFMTSVRDVNDFVQFISKEYDIDLENITVVGQSVGAALVAVWAHDYAPKVRALILASPAFKVKLYIPFARFFTGLWQKMKGVFFVNSHVKAKFLTHDPLRIRSFESDPLITRAIASNILLELYTHSERVVADAGAIVLPTQLLMSGSDWVVHQEPQHEFFANLGSLVKERHVFKGFYHDTLGELERELAFVKMRAFLEQVYDERPVPFPLDRIQTQSSAATEFFKLQAPLPALSFKNINFQSSRLMMKTLGRLSEGIKLGLETGFDSGSTLDYVYENNPRGRTAIGLGLDIVYLKSIGWRGIRMRKTHLEELIIQAVDALSAKSEPVQVLDIAAGHGRYVLDALQPKMDQVSGILLRDYSDLNVAAGQKRIADMGLSDKAAFVKGNAFDRSSISSLSPHPTLAIVSGLYELFADNLLLQASLAGIADAVPVGGYLIYTNQPWHPQLEFIARVLSSHREGDAWVMRRRTQAEMDALVAGAGFEKIEQRIDEFGIFTVSLAKRVA